MQPSVPKKLTRIVSVVAVFIALIAAGKASAQTERERMIEHYQMGAKYFHEGRYKESKAEFEALLKMNPSGDDAVLIRERAGIDELIMLWREPEFRALIKPILDRSLERSEELRRDVENIGKYIKQFESEDSRKVWEAIYRLARIGPFAVPQLLDYLSLD